MKGATTLRPNDVSYRSEQLVHQEEGTSEQQKGLIKKMPFLRETESSPGPRIQLGSVVGVLMPLSENDRRRLGYPAASSSRECRIMSVPNLYEHGYMTYGST